VDNELEVIRHQMEEKRASLADKLDLLENQVLETVHEATEGVSQIVDTVTSTVGSVTDNVQETVQSVKDSLTEGVQETVESVKQTFDVRDRIRRNPWMSLGGAFAVGLAGGYFLSPSSTGDRKGQASYQPRFGPEFAPAAAERSAAPPAEPARKEAPSPLEEAAHTALTGLKGLAIGALMGVLREVATNTLPAALKDEVANMLNQVNTQLGGKNLGDLGIMEAFQGHGNGADTARETDPSANDRFAQRANGR